MAYSVCHPVPDVRLSACNRVPLIYGFSDGPPTSDKAPGVVEVRQILGKAALIERKVVTAAT